MSKKVEDTESESENEGEERDSSEDEDEQIVDTEAKEDIWQVYRGHSSHFRPFLLTPNSLLRFPNSFAIGTQPM